MDMHGQRLHSKMTCISTICDNVIPNVKELLMTDQHIRDTR